MRDTQYCISIKAISISNCQHTLQQYRTSQRLESTDGLNLNPVTKNNFSKNHLSWCHIYTVTQRKIPLLFSAKWSAWKWDGMGQNAILALPWSALDHTTTSFLRNTIPLCGRVSMHYTMNDYLKSYTTALSGQRDFQPWMHPETICWPGSAQTNGEWEVHTAPQTPYLDREIGRDRKEGKKQERKKERKARKGKDHKMPYTALPAV